LGADIGAGCLVLCLYWGPKEEGESERFGVRTAWWVRRRRFLNALQQEPLGMSGRCFTRDDEPNERAEINSAQKCMWIVYCTVVRY
jgi:hypothetical protein